MFSVTVTWCLTLFPINSFYYQPNHYRHVNGCFYGYVFLTQQEPRDGALDKTTLLYTNLLLNAGKRIQINSVNERSHYEIIIFGCIYIYVHQFLTIVCSTSAVRGMNLLTLWMILLYVSYTCHKHKCCHKASIISRWSLWVKWIEKNCELVLFVFERYNNPNGLITSLPTSKWLGDNARYTFGNTA